MYTTGALLDFHARAHLSLERLLAHCRQLGTEELSRELPGFGFPTVRLQLHHEIGAEEYWVGVLMGRLDAKDDDEDYPDVESLESYRRQVFSSTAEYLRSASQEELNTARTMLTWGDKEQRLIPAHVVLRVLTHYFQHQGQIVAMCRLLGNPAGGLDFPLAPPRE